MSQLCPMINKISCPYNFYSSSFWPPSADRLNNLNSVESKHRMVLLLSILPILISLSNLLKKNSDKSL